MSQPVEKRYFGTDGIRGRVGDYPITPDFMLKLGWAAGKVFAAADERRGGARSKILIGKDTRISGYMFEAALEAGLSSAGVDINMLGPMPTPAIAYLTRTFQASAGIVISASHNHFQDNGIKFFSSGGTKLPDEVELAIESWLDEPITTVSSAAIGKVTRIGDAGGRYIEYCKSTIPDGHTLHGLNIVVDCAHGSTYAVAASVFSELGARVHAIGVTPDGLNINEQCGSTSPQSLASEVLARQADLGIAFDGDGDRLIMVDRHGAIIDGDQILYLIAADRCRRERSFGGVVGTTMSNLGLERSLAALGVPFHRSDVGDRYVMSELRKRGWLLGGESSGHIVSLDVSTTGDGIVSALQALGAVVGSGCTLDELCQGMPKMPQHMINVPVASRQQALQDPRIGEAVGKTEKALGDAGRVLLRASGTEPLVRVMIEGEDEARIRTLTAELADCVARCAGAQS